MLTQKDSILNGKRILGLSDQPKVLVSLEEKILEACPECKFDKATNYKEAVEKMVSWTYDLVILDIMDERCLDLFELIGTRNFPMVMLTQRALSPETLRHFIHRIPRALFPKDKLGEIVPFLENTVRKEGLSKWKRLVENIKGFLLNHFESDWEKKTGLLWHEWQRWD
jgi:CheY-like chemotaxis protein